MTPLRALAGLLVLQIALAVFTWWPPDRSALVPHPLLELDAASIDEIAIGRRPTGDAAEQEPSWLRLRREGEGWQIETTGEAAASLNGYPADPAKVTALLDRLVGLRVRAPIQVLIMIRLSQASKVAASRSCRRERQAVRKTCCARSSPALPLGSGFGRKREQKKSPQPTMATPCSCS